MDKSSEKIIFRMKDKSWSITLNEDSDEDKYYTCMGIGYIKFVHNSRLNNEFIIEQECTQFVPLQDSCKVSIIKLKNTSNHNVTMKVKYDLNLQMGELKSDSRFVRKNYKKGLNMITFNNIKNPWYMAYISCNEKINEDEEVEITLNSNEEKEVVFVFGSEEDEMRSLEIGAKYLSNYEIELENTKQYWRELTGKVKCNTPLKTFDIMQNSWLVYQTLSSRMWGRTGYYQSSGGFGYRDQLQDSLGMKYVNPEILRNQILLCSRHQFEEGDVEHWWHEDSKLRNKN